MSCGIWFTGGAGIRVKWDDSSVYEPKAEDVSGYSIWLADVNVANFDTGMSSEYVGISINVK